LTFLLTFHTFGISADSKHFKLLHGATANHQWFTFSTSLLCLYNLNVNSLLHYNLIVCFEEENEKQSASASDAKHRLYKLTVIELKAEFFMGAKASH
jgi:hypothetical protein